MRLLLDTHTLLWFVQQPEILPPKVVDAIEEAATDAAVSVASLWEIAIKVSINKLRLPKPFEELFPQSVSESGLSLLEIDAKHLALVSRLSLHHRDPFDRLIIAQAQAEGLTVVTGDPAFSQYDVPVLW